MELDALTACTILLTAILLSCPASVEQNRDLTASGLIAEYERLIPTNQALQRGQWVINPADYPKVLGNYNSRQVEEEFVCGAFVRNPAP